MSKEYNVPAILARAEQLGIILNLEGDNLKVLAPPGLPQIKKALAVLKEYKAAIVAHLRNEISGRVCTVDEPTMDEPEIPERCADCGVHIESQDRGFFYVPLSNELIACYCELCRNPDTGQPWPARTPQGAILSTAHDDERVPGEAHDFLVATGCSAPDQVINRENQKDNLVEEQRPSDHGVQAAREDCGRCPVAVHAPAPASVVSEATLAGQVVQGTLRPARVLASPSDVTALGHRLEAGATYVVDLETTGLDALQAKVVSIALGSPGAVTVMDVRGFYRASSAEQERWKVALQALFHRPDVVWAGHNLKFDWAFLAAHFGVRLTAVYDTMLVEQLLHNGLVDVSVSLRATAERYDLAVSKAERNWFVGLDQRPFEWAAPFPPEQLAYMAQDIEVPSVVREQQLAAIAAGGLEEVVRLEHGALPAIAAMEVAGISVDVMRWRAVLASKQERQAELEAQLEEILGQALASTQQATQQTLFGESVPVAIDLSSIDQVRAALATLGIEVVSLRAEELEGLKNAHTVIPLLLEWKALKKFTSAFGESVLAHVKADGRIHAHFRQIGAMSGRVICRDPNLQQIPRTDDDAQEDDIRACFVAGPGNVLVIADLPNIELRILADFSREPGMLDAFARGGGGDLHAATARLMFDLPVGTDTKKHLINGISARQIAKQINFGLSYGMFEKSLAQRIGCDVTLAKTYRARYLATYPRAMSWLHAQARKAMATGMVTTPSGRQRRYAQEGMKEAQHDWKRRGEMERSAQNHPVQGTNADILKRALALLHQRLPQGVLIVLTVHDEIVLECPEALQERTAQQLSACLLEACRDFLKVVVVPAPDVVLSSYWRK